MVVGHAPGREDRHSATQPTSSPGCTSAALCRSCRRARLKPLPGRMGTGQARAAGVGAREGAGTGGAAPALGAARPGPAGAAVPPPPRVPFRLRLLRRHWRPLSSEPPGSRFGPRPWRLAPYPAPCFAHRQPAFAVCPSKPALLILRVPVTCVFWTPYFRWSQSNVSWSDSAVGYSVGN